MGGPGTEDEKIITLARSARAPRRGGRGRGGAGRDGPDAALRAAVNLPTLRLSALRLAVAMAVSSGATVLEAAALVSDADAPDPARPGAGAGRRPGAVVFHVGADGAIRATLSP